MCELRGRFSVIVAAIIVTGHRNEAAGENKTERGKGVNFREQLQNRSRGNFNVALTTNPSRFQAL